MLNMESIRGVQDAITYIEETADRFEEIRPLCCLPTLWVS